MSGLNKLKLFTYNTILPKIQTVSDELNLKEPNTVLISSDSGTVASSEVSTTELGHLNFVSDRIQTQLDSGNVSMVNTSNELVLRIQNVSSDLTLGISTVSDSIFEYLNVDSMPNGTNGKYIENGFYYGDLNISGNLVVTNYSANGASTSILSSTIDNVSEIVSMSLEGPVLKINEKAQNNIMELSHGTEMMVTMLHDGKLGIGKSAPTATVDVAGNVKASGTINGVTAQSLGYLSGVTDNIQTQIDNHAAAISAASQSSVGNLNYSTSSNMTNAISNMSNHMVSELSTSSRDVSNYITDVTDQKQDVINFSKTFVRGLDNSISVKDTIWDVNANNISYSSSVFGPTVNVYSDKVMINTLQAALVSDVDNKQDIITGAATTIMTDSLTANKIVVSDANGKVSTHSATSAELDHLANVTTSIQGQIDGIPTNIATVESDLTIQRDAEYNNMTDYVNSVISDELAKTAGKQSAITSVSGGTLSKAGNVISYTLSASDIDNLVQEQSYWTKAAPSDNFISYSNVLISVDNISTKITQVFQEPHIVDSGIVQDNTSFVNVGDNQYIYSFTNSSNDKHSITFPQDTVVDVLIVGGGGSGGHGGNGGSNGTADEGVGGGGGGGSVYVASSVVVPANTKFPIVVGKGGIAAFGENGGDSSVFGITAAGGGAGGNSDTINGMALGTGGGGGINLYTSNVGLGGAVTDKTGADGAILNIGDEGLGGYMEFPRQNMDADTFTYTDGIVVECKASTVYSSDVLYSPYKLFDGHANTFQDSQERIYPPIDLTTLTDTISDQRYGNGQYIVSSGDGYTHGWKLFSDADAYSVGPWHAGQYYVDWIPGTGYIVSDFTAHWIKIQLPVKIKLTKYTFIGGAPPGRYKIYASNDDDMWYEIVSATLSSGDYVNNTFNENVNVNQYFKYFALAIKTAAYPINTQRPSLNRWNLYGKEAFELEQYSWLSGIDSGTGETYDESGNALVTYKSEYSGEWVMVDLGEDVIVRQTKLYPLTTQLTRQPKEFRIYGTNDGTAFSSGNLNDNQWNLLYNGVNSTEITFTENNPNYIAAKYPRYPLTGDTTTYPDGSGTVVRLTSSSQYDTGANSRFGSFNHNTSDYGWSSAINTYDPLTGESKSSSYKNGYDGSYITIDLGERIILDNIKIYPRIDSGNNPYRRPKEFRIYASNSLTSYDDINDPNWALIFEGYNASNGSGTTPHEYSINSSVGYQYYTVVINKIFIKADSNSVLFAELEFYSKASQIISSIPPFVQPTITYERLDTTSIRKYPPVGLAPTGNYDTVSFGDMTVLSGNSVSITKSKDDIGYFSYGSGTYEISWSSWFDDGVTRRQPLHIFDGVNIDGENVGHFAELQYSAIAPYEYIGSDVGINGYTGDWVKLKLPKAIWLSHFVITGSTVPNDVQNAKDFKVFGRKDELSPWIEVLSGTATYTNNVYTSTSRDVVNNRESYIEYALVVNTIIGNLQALMIVELEFYGNENGELVEPVQLATTGDYYYDFTKYYDTIQIQYPRQAITGSSFTYMVHGTSFTVNVKSSSTYQTRYAYQLFDRETTGSVATIGWTSGTASYAANSGGSLYSSSGSYYAKADYRGEFIMIDLGEQAIITDMKVWRNTANFNRKAKDYRLYGSNDLDDYNRTTENWTELFDKVGSGTTGGSDNPTHDTFTNTNSFRYYALVIKRIFNTVADYAELFELELFGPGLRHPNDIRKYPEIPYTEDSQDITYSSFLPDFESGEAYHIFDTIENTYASSWRSLYSDTFGYNVVTREYEGIHGINGYKGDWVCIDLKQFIILKEYTLYGATENDANLKRSPGDFKVFGSKDNVTHFELDEQVGLIWSGTTGKTFTISSNNEPYRYYTIVFNKISQIYPNGPYRQVIVSEWELYGYPAPVNTNYSVQFPKDTDVQLLTDIDGLVVDNVSFSKDITYQIQLDTTGTWEILDNSSTVVTTGTLGTFGLSEGYENIIVKWNTPVYPVTYDLSNNFIPYRYYAIVINKIYTNGLFVQFAEWELLGNKIGNFGGGGGGAGGNAALVPSSSYPVGGSGFVTSDIIVGEFGSGGSGGSTNYSGYGGGHGTNIGAYDNANGGNGVANTGGGGGGAKTGGVGGDGGSGLVVVKWYADDKITFTNIVTQDELVNKQDTLTFGQGLSYDAPTNTLALTDTPLWKDEGSHVSYGNVKVYDNKITIGSKLTSDAKNFFNDTTDMLAWYKFDGDFTDSSGNGNDLTGGIGTTFIDDSMVGSKSINFPNTTTQGLSSTVDLSGKTSFSVSSWVYRNANDVADIYFSTPYIGAANRTLHIGYRLTNTFTFAFFGGNDLNTEVFLEDIGKWNNWICTYDSSSRKRNIYKNGILVANDVATADSNFVTGLVIGNYNTTYFNGKLDDVRVYNRVLTPNEIQTLYNGEYIVSKNFLKDTSDMYVWYKFNGDFKDDSGYGRDAFAFNTPTFDESLKKEGTHSVSFAGGVAGTVSQYLTVPSTNFSLWDGFTMSCWVMFEDNASYARIIDFGDGQANNGMVFSRNAGGNKLLMHMYHGTTISDLFATTNDVIVNNTWMHVVWSITKVPSWKLYVNGVSQQLNSGTFKYPVSATYANCYIAKSNSAADPYFKGKMDDFRIYKRALVAEEVEILYNGTMSTYSTGELYVNTVRAKEITALGASPYMQIGNHISVAKDTQQTGVLKGSYILSPKLTGTYTKKTLYSDQDNEVYEYAQFTNNGTIAFPQDTVCDILLVGGGGSGNIGKGGGSSGGLIYATNQNIPFGTYPITVGTGGINGNGGDTSAFGAIAKGGIRATTIEGATKLFDNDITSSILTTYNKNSGALAGGSTNYSFTTELPFVQPTALDFNSFPSVKGIAHQFAAVGNGASTSGLYWGGNGSASRRVRIKGSSLEMNVTSGAYVNPDMLFVFNSRFTGYMYIEGYFTNQWKILRRVYVNNALSIRVNRVVLNSTLNLNTLAGENINYLLDDSSHNCTFKNTNTSNPSLLILSQNTVCDILAVGGGGGGGGSLGGGGGGGAVVYLQSVTLTAGTYNVYVGQGGSGGTISTASGKGGNTRILKSDNSIDITAEGGGTSSFWSEGDGGIGGSGGGGCANTTTGTLNTGGAIGTSSTYTGITGNINIYGNKGSSMLNLRSNDLTPICSGGGGGAGTEAIDINPEENSGNGGDGILINMDGNDYYWAGGGGGGQLDGTSLYAGNGGLGGGGGGSASGGTGPELRIGIGGANAINNGSSGTVGNGGNGGANTGGGGGGGAYNANGGAGGSGIVIIRFPVQTIQEVSIQPSGGGGIGSIGGSNTGLESLPNGGEGFPVSIRLENELFAGGGGANGGTRVPSGNTIGYGGNSTATTAENGGNGIAIIRWKNQDDNINRISGDNMRILKTVQSFAAFFKQPTLMNATSNEIVEIPGNTPYEKYFYTKFTDTTTPGSITFDQDTECDILVVGGGGGGGRSIGGGGGAGAVVYIQNAILSSGRTYSVTVGDGGTAGNPSGKGQNSTFGDVIAEGGGGVQGGYSTGYGLIGGSGGGAAGPDPGIFNQGGAVGTSSSLGDFEGNIYGNRGGHIIGSRTGIGSVHPTSGTGGGGAGGAAKDIDVSIESGNGGIGIQIDITGDNIYYGGGGGGGGYSIASGTGGLGGGGSGGGKPGTTNTGGGGGGGSYNANGGKGGSGIVIIRWKIPSSLKFDTVFSQPTLANATNNQIMKHPTDKAYYSTFTDTTADGSIAFEQDTVCDILIVGGGGAGGVGKGGGSSGGILYATNQLIPAGIYPITVGAGGTVAVNGNGGDSVAFGATAKGGLQANTINDEPNIPGTTVAVWDENKIALDRLDFGGIFITTPLIKFPRENFSNTVLSKTYTSAPVGTVAQVKASSVLNPSTTGVPIIFNGNRTSGEFISAAGRYDASTFFAVDTYRTDYAGEYIMIDLGESIYLESFKIYFNSAQNHRKPVSFRMYASDTEAVYSDAEGETTGTNNPNWTQIYEETENTSYVTGTVFAIATLPSTSSRYYMLIVNRINSDTNGYLSIGELELYGNTTTGTTPPLIEFPREYIKNRFNDYHIYTTVRVGTRFQVKSASQLNNDWKAGNMFNGDRTSGRFRSRTGVYNSTTLLATRTFRTDYAGEYFIIDLGESIFLSSFDIYFNLEEDDSKPTSFRIYASDTESVYTDIEGATTGTNNPSWTQIYEETDNRTYTPGTKFTIPTVPSTLSRYYMLIVNKFNGNSNGLIQITSFELFGYTVLPTLSAGGGGVGSIGESSMIYTEVREYPRYALTGGSATNFVYTAETTNSLTYKVRVSGNYLGGSDDTILRNGFNKDITDVGWELGGIGLPGGIPELRTGYNGVYVMIDLFNVVILDNFVLYPRVQVQKLGVGAGREDVANRMPKYFRLYATNTDVAFTEADTTTTGVNHPDWTLLYERTSDMDDGGASSDGVNYSSPTTSTPMTVNTNTITTGYRYYMLLMNTNWGDSWGFGFAEWTLNGKEILTISNGGEGFPVSIRTPNELFAGGGGVNGGTRVPPGNTIGYGGNSTETTAEDGGGGIVIIKWYPDKKVVYDSQEHCLRTKRNIWMDSANVIWTSDIRIKKEVQDIDDDSALEQVLLLEPKTYKYKNALERGNNKVFGFISQQVEDVIPEATTKTTNFIPNVYQHCEYTNEIVNNIPNSTILLPSDYDIATLSVAMNSSNISTKVRLMNEKSESAELDFVLTSNVSGYGLMTEDISDFTDNSSNVFVFGTQVEDMTTIDKSYLYTLNVCATQVLSRKIDTLEASNSAMMARIEQLESELDILQNSFNN